MRRCLALVPLLAATVPAWAMQMGSTPLLVQAGATYLSTDLRRELATDWGMAGGIATLLSESGFLGVPSLDLNLRYAPDGEGSLLAFEATYAERALIGGQTWVGLGFGSNFVRLKLDPTEEREAQADRRWAIGGKAMVGYLITNRVFVEATYHYTRRVLDLETASATIALGYWF